MAPGKTTTVWFGNQQLSNNLLEPAASDSSLDITDRPDVPFDEAGYDGHVYDDSGSEPSTSVYLPLLLR